jgi:hypothetical protein
MYDKFNFYVGIIFIVVGIFILLVDALIQTYNLPPLCQALGAIFIIVGLLILILERKPEE